MALAVVKKKKKKSERLSQGYASETQVRASERWDREKDAAANETDRVWGRDGTGRDLVGWLVGGLCNVDRYVQLSRYVYTLLIHSYNSYHRVGCTRDCGRADIGTV